MAESELRLKVKTLQPATYEVTAAAQSTVQQLKEQLVALSGIPVDRQRLIFRGAVLQNTGLLTDQHIEDGHTLHLVERPEGLPPAGAAPEPEVGRRTEQRINIGMIDMNGAFAAAGGVNGFLQNLVGQMGNPHMQVVTHPPMGNHQGAPQVVQMMSVNGGPNTQQAPHQLTALNSYLLHLDTDPPANSLPPFSMVGRIGQVEADEAAFLDAARAALNGVNLSPEVQEFVRSCQPTDFRAVSTDQPLAAAEDEGQPGLARREGEAQRDPRRNGLDGFQGRPHPVSVGNDTLRLGTLALTEVARQAIVHIQSQALPSLASATRQLHRQAQQGAVTASDVQAEASRISNTAYNVGNLLLELSLATANLSQAASGNASPLLCAQTGFLSPDGSHAHVTNRVPNPFPTLNPPPPWQGAPQNAIGSRNATPQSQPAGSAQPQLVPPQGMPPQGVPVQIGVMRSAVEGARPGPPPGAMDMTTPLGHAFFAAVTDDETRTRHMRLPVRLPNGSSIRLDLSSVVNAVESLVLSAPTQLISSVLAAANPGGGDGEGNLRQLMSRRQTEEQRRQVYLNLTQPILQAALESIWQYFQQIYRVTPRQSGEDQPAIRPTRRAANRPVPSLTHPFARIPSAMRGQMPFAHAGSETGNPPGGMTIGIPGGQMHVEMSVEAPMLDPRPSPQQHEQSRGQGDLQAPAPEPVTGVSWASRFRPGYRQHGPPQQPSDPAMEGHESGGRAAPPAPYRPTLRSGSPFRFSFSPQGEPGIHQGTRPSGSPQRQDEGNALHGRRNPSRGHARASGPSGPSGDIEAPPTDKQEGQVSGFEERSGRQPTAPPAVGPSSSAPASQVTEPIQEGHSPGPSSSCVASGVAKGLGTGLPALPSRKHPSAAGRGGKSPQTGGNSSQSKGAKLHAAKDELESTAKHQEGSGSAEAGAPRRPSAGLEARPNSQQPPRQSQRAARQDNIGDMMTQLLSSSGRGGPHTSNTGGGGLAGIMSQMLQSPAIQQLMESPEMQRIADSPAFAQMGNPPLSSQVHGTSGSQPQTVPNLGSQSAASAADLGNMMQSLMPVVQQMVGGLSRRPDGLQQRSNAAAGPRPSSASPHRENSNTDLAELDALPDEDADRWRRTILADRTKQRGSAALPVSDAYKEAFGQQVGPGQQGSSLTEMTELD